MRARCRRRGGVWDNRGGVGEADHALFQSPARRIGDASGSPESPAEPQRGRPVEARGSAAPRRSVARTRTTRSASRARSCRPSRRRTSHFAGRFEPGSACARSRHKRGAGIRLIHRRSTRSLRSCARPETVVTAGGCGVWSLCSGARAFGSMRPSRSPRPISTSGAAVC